MYGSIDIGDAGEEIGSGAAFHLYGLLKEEHTRTAPLRDPETPPADWPASADVYRDKITAGNVARLRDWARTAMAFSRWFAYMHLVKEGQA
jgi:hypothetical protein